MAHLGDDLAAYVDGQLSVADMVSAEEHLAGCDRCRQTVAQQRMLKARMGGSAIPMPDASFLASLDEVPSTRGRHYSLIPGAVGALMVLIGASMMVVATAYAVAPEDRTGDAVRPQFDRFANLATSISQSQRHLSTPAMDALNRSGWPSRQQLGAGFVRVDGRMHDGREVVAQTYVGHGETLTLFEQVGSLDDDATASFDRRVVAGRPVWARDGRPRIITWDAEGMVYTIVTEMPDGRLAHLLEDLPAPPPAPTPVERIGAGLVRMSSWL